MECINNPPTLEMECNNHEDLNKINQLLTLYNWGSNVHQHMITFIYYTLYISYTQHSLFPIQIRARTVPYNYLLHLFNNKKL